MTWIILWSRLIVVFVLSIHWYYNIRAQDCFANKCNLWKSAKCVIRMNQYLALLTVYLTSMCLPKWRLDIVIKPIPVWEIYILILGNRSTLPVIRVVKYKTLFWIKRRSYNSLHQDIMHPIWDNTETNNYTLLYWIRHVGCLRSSDRSVNSWLRTSYAT